MQIYNKFDKDAEAVENNLKKARHVEAARAIYADKPFSERYATAATAAQILGVVGNVGSFVTGSLAVGYSIYSSISVLGDTVAIGAGGAIGIAAAALLEIVKTAMIIGVFTALYKYKKISIGIAVAAITLQGASIALSFYGARAMPKLATSAPPPFNSSEYDKRAEAIATEIASIRKANSWKGVVTKKGNEFIAQANERAERVDNERAEAKAAHEIKTAKTEAEQGETINIVGYIGIANEVLILFCFAFYSYFLYRVYRENEESEGDGANSPTVATTTAPAPPPTMPIMPTTPNTGQPAPPSNRNPIGFIFSGETETVIIKPEPPIDNKNPHLKECEHCQKQYQYNAKKQKFCSNECRWEASKARKAAAE